MSRRALNREWVGAETGVCSDLDLVLGPEALALDEDGLGVVSLIDRLAHRCEVVLIEGESYRLKEAK